MVTAYYGCFHTHLMYGTSAWGNSPMAKKVFIRQKQAIRMICGVKRKTHCKPIFKKLKILTLPAIYILQIILHVKREIQNFPKNGQNTVRYLYPNRPY